VFVVLSTGWTESITPIVEMRIFRIAQAAADLSALRKEGVQFGNEDRLEFIVEINFPCCP
jgi:hypothetical protein